MKSFRLVSFLLHTLVILAVYSADVSAISKSSPDSKQTQNLGAQNTLKHDWLFSVLQVNYVLLNALDLFTTYQGLERGAREVNPIARAFIKRKPLAIAVKGVATGGVLFALSHVKESNPTAAYVTLGILNLIYGAVVHNNITIILRLPR